MLCCLLKWMTEESNMSAFSMKIKYWLKALQIPILILAAKSIANTNINTRSKKYCQ